MEIRSKRPNSIIFTLSEQKEINNPDFGSGLY
jgi:hypothetical protein